MSPLSPLRAPVPSASNPVSLSRRMSEVEGPPVPPKEPPVSVLSASPFLARFIEMVLCALCFSLICVPYDNRLYKNVHRAGFVYTSFLMPFLIDVIVLICHFRKQPFPKLSVYLISGLFGLMLLTAGLIVICDWYTLMRSIHFHPPKMFMDIKICSGVFSVLTSLVSFVNIFLTYKYY